MAKRSHKRKRGRGKLTSFIKKEAHKAKARRHKRQQAAVKRRKAAKKAHEKRVAERKHRRDVQKKEVAKRRTHRKKERELKKKKSEDWWSGKTGRKQIAEGKGLFGKKGPLSDVGRIAGDVGKGLGKGLGKGGLGAFDPAGMIKTYGTYAAIGLGGLLVLKVIV